MNDNAHDPENRPLTRSFDELCLEDLPEVGGKNASLGEMQQRLSNLGIKLAPGFATTAEFFTAFIEQNALQPIIDQQLAALADTDQSLAATGRNIRAAFLEGTFTAEQTTALSNAYHALSRCCENEDVAVAVRSSNVSQHIRRRVTDRGLQKVLCLALYRSGNHLSGGARFSGCAGRSFRWRAADGAR
jgi:pyruvate,water dikinase